MPGFAIQMRKISKQYSGQFANQEIDFELKKGTIHAIAGENGAGKSTLMKILFGLVKPEEDSEIFVSGMKVKFKSPLDSIESGIGMVQQHFALAGVLTALENIILGDEPNQLGVVDLKKAKDQIQKLGHEELNVPWDELTKNLSVGLQQRIEILKLLFRKARVLILDEPTGVLTPSEVTAFFNLLRRMRSEGHSIIIITHKIDEILSLCDEVTVLRQGKRTGHFEVKGLTKETLVEAMIGRKLKSDVLNQNLPKSSSALIEVKDLSFKKDSRGSLKNINFKLLPGEILGIAGVEGNGQQTLVESLLGLEKYSGQIFFKGKEINANKTNVRKKLNFGLISEDRHHQSLWLDESIESNCMLGLSEKFSKWGYIQKNELRKFSQNITQNYDVRMQNFTQPIKSLSGGNQQKVIIAREVTGRQPEFLIASQPTRGVDVGAIEAIHSALADLASKGSGILLISSELEEICKLSHRVLVLSEGKIAGEFMGPQFDLQKIGSAMTA